MKVYGFEVPAAVECAIIERMKAAPFQSLELANVACEMPGAPSAEVAHRIADRIIQRERKKKNIEITKYPRWEWKP